MEMWTRIFITIFLPCNSFKTRINMYIAKNKTIQYLKERSKISEDVKKSIN